MTTMMIQRTSAQRHIRRSEQQACPGAAVTVLLLFGLMLSSAANAFSVLSKNMALPRQPPTRTTYSRDATSSRRHAVIYGADGETYYDDDSSSSSSSSSSKTLYYEDDDAPVFTMASIIESLSAETAALARMAVAFAPKEHNLKLEDIHQVHVLNVDTSYIELSAVLCEHYDCLTVAVPVSFPRSCHGVKPSAVAAAAGHSESLEDCIVDNLSQLWEMAEIKIQDIELGCPRTKIWKSLIQTDNLDLPFWWVELKPLQADCDSMRSLLNDDDFQAELQALASKTIAERTDDEFIVDQVGVAAVGPAGMFLRAHASGHILELPIGFPSGVVTTVDGLRGSVLEMVEQLEECLE